MNPQDVRNPSAPHADTPIRVLGAVPTPEQYRRAAQQYDASDPQAPSVTQLLAEQFRQEQEAERELYPDVNALIPWELAPDYSWMLALLWRADGSLEAHWHRGAERLPAYELTHASNEFFEACQALPQDGSAIGFQRMYGARPANPWDWDFAVWFHAWYEGTKQAQAGIVLQPPDPNYKRPKAFTPKTLVAESRLWCAQIRSNHFLH